MEAGDCDDSIAGPNGKATLRQPGFTAKQVKRLVQRPLGCGRPRRVLCSVRRLVRTREFITRRSIIYNQRSLA